MIERALHWLDRYVVQPRNRQHIVVENVEIDRYGDIELFCPHCRSGFFVAPTAEEKRKYVFIIRHPCDAADSVIFHVKLKRKPSELIRIWEQRFPDDPLPPELRE